MHRIHILAAIQVAQVWLPRFELLNLLSACRYLLTELKQSDVRVKTTLTRPGYLCLFRALLELLAEAECGINGLELSARRMQVLEDFLLGGC